LTKEQACAATREPAAAKGATMPQSKPAPGRTILAVEQDPGGIPIS
jgi:hypothetical protein